LDTFSENGENIENMFWDIIIYHGMYWMGYTEMFSVIRTSGIEWDILKGIYHWTFWDCNPLNGIYPLVISYSYWTWPFSSLIYQLRIVIFYSYVSLPEGFIRTNGETLRRNGTKTHG
jgi:hypothetical protein